MKKGILVFLLCILLTSLLVPANAAPKNTPQYSLPQKGLSVLQSLPDRSIQPQAEAIRHQIISGESPVTGLPWSDLYLPMLVQISNVSDSVKIKGRTIKVAGLGKRAPWGV